MDINPETGMPLQWANVQGSHQPNYYPHLSSNMFDNCQYFEDQNCIYGDQIYPQQMPMFYADNSCNFGPEQMIADNMMSRRLPRTSFEQSTLQGDYFHDPMEMNAYFDENGQAIHPVMAQKLSRKPPKTSMVPQPPSTQQTVTLQTTGQPNGEQNSKSQKKQDQKFFIIVPPKNGKSEKKSGKKGKKIVYIKNGRQASDDSSDSSDNESNSDTSSSDSSSSYEGESSCRGKQRRKKCSCKCENRPKSGCTCKTLLIVDKPQPVSANPIQPQPNQPVSCEKPQAETFWCVRGDVPKPQIKPYYNAQRPTSRDDFEIQEKVAIIDSEENDVIINPSANITDNGSTGLYSGRAPIPVNPCTIVLPPKTCPKLCNSGTGPAPMLILPPQPIDSDSGQRLINVYAGYSEKPVVRLTGVGVQNCDNNIITGKYTSGYGIVTENGNGNGRMQRANTEEKSIVVNY